MRGERMGWRIGVMFVYVLPFMYGLCRALLFSPPTNSFLSIRTLRLDQFTVHQFLAALVIALLCSPFKKLRVYGWDMARVNILLMLSLFILCLSPFIMLVLGFMGEGGSPDSPLEMAIVIGTWTAAIITLLSSVLFPLNIFFATLRHSIAILKNEEFQPLVARVMQIPRYIKTTIYNKLKWIKRFLPTIKASVNDKHFLPNEKKWACLIHLLPPIGTVAAALLFLNYVFIGVIPLALTLIVLHMIAGLFSPSLALSRQARLVFNSYSNLLISFSIISFLIFLLLYTHIFSVDLLFIILFPWIIVILLFLRIIAESFIGLFFAFKGNVYQSKIAVPFWSP